MLALVLQKRGVAAVLLVVLSGASTCAPAPALQLRTDASRRVNAVYHLACLARTITCTRQIFERFWQGTLGWTPADQAALDEWRQVMAEVTARAPARTGAPLLLNTPRFHPAQASRGRVFVAAVESRSAPDIQRRSLGVLSAHDASRLAAAIDHFDRRLDPWWRSETSGRRAVQDRLERVADQVRETGMPSVMAEVAAFLEAEVADPVLHLHAIISPVPSSEDYTATQSGSHFFVEAVDSATTHAFVHGAVHELTHYLYDSAPADKHIGLVREFAESGAEAFAGLYTYLNEAIAVAAQGLYAEKQQALDTDTRGYTHPYIQPLGTATGPLLREAIAKRQTLFSGFATSYIAAATGALKSKVQEPRFVLSQVALVVPEDGDRLSAAYHSTMFPQASAQFRMPAEVDAFPDLSVVQFVRYDAVDALADRIPELLALRARSGFAYAMKRGPRAFTYVLAGRDTDAIVEAIAKLGTLERLNTGGLLFSFD